jgi:hypothetical protein
MGTIRVRRGEVDRQALREALNWLAEGGVLGVAPDGTRARGPFALQEGKTGLAYPATRANVPILPAGIAGTERSRMICPGCAALNCGSPSVRPSICQRLAALAAASCASTRSVLCAASQRCSLRRTGASTARDWPS